MAGDKVQFETGSIEAGLANGARLLETTPPAAALQARAILKLDPQNTAAHRLFAKAMSAIGRTEDARMARARAVQFSRHVPAIAQAHQAALDGRPDVAEEMLRDHLGHYPDDPVALMVTGEALARMGRVREAVRNFEAALAFMPEYVEARVGLVRVYQNHFDPAAALEELESLLAERPGDVSLRRWKASLLSNLGENAAAAEILAGTAADEPGNPEIWISLGDELRTSGQADEAAAAYRRATKVAPSMGQGWWGLAALRNAPFDDADRAQMETALAKAPPVPETAYLEFAYAIAQEEIGDRGKAFRHFAAGNALQLDREPFDPAIVANEVERSREFLTAEFFPAHWDPKLRIPRGQVVAAASIVSPKY